MLHPSALMIRRCITKPVWCTDRILLRGHPSGRHDLHEVWNKLSDETMDSIGCITFSLVRETKKKRGRRDTGESPADADQKFTTFTFRNVINSCGKSAHGTAPCTLRRLPRLQKHNLTTYVLGVCSRMFAWQQFPGWDEREETGEWLGCWNEG
jgi:hypothetical protein